MVSCDRLIFSCIFCVLAQFRSRQLVIITSKSYGGTCTVVKGGPQDEVYIQFSSSTYNKSTVSGSRCGTTRVISLSKFNSINE
ncbi:hypothetical protein BC629DRAFT_1026284 [Irpex lacteus]|nr:hypothetical protein BC629DRAFT_1026284 [Irpex lacteus]